MRSTEIIQVYWSLTVLLAFYVIIMRCEKNILLYN